MGFFTDDEIDKWTDEYMNRYDDLDYEFEKNPIMLKYNSAANIRKKYGLIRKMAEKSVRTGSRAAHPRDYSYVRHVFCRSPLHIQR